MAMQYLKRPSSIHTYIPWLLLISFFLASLISLWPGVMSPDATTQYVAAKSGVYSDHHPPLMSFVWRYLDYLYPCPASMFILHLSMLYAATAILMLTFNKSKFKWWYAFYPVLPNLLAYTALIVKDTGFTFTYLLSAALMTFLCYRRVQKYKLPLLVLMVVLLFYGTAVKFQAKFILVFFTIGIGYCLFDYKLNRNSMFTGLILCVVILSGITYTNAKLVPSTHEAHSWQLVKIYDLSAISVALNTPLYPDFIKAQANYDFTNIKNAFLTREVDPLVFGEDPIIRSGKTPEHRQILWDYWFKTIQQHPWLYLQSRLKLFSYNLTTAPCDRNNPVKFLASTALAPLLAVPGISNIIDAGYMLFKIMLRFMWFFPLVFVYAYLGIRYFKKSRTAAPLLLLSLSSMVLMFVLLFFSMAATARYVFLCTCFTHAAHGLAWVIWQEQKQRSIPDASTLGAKILYFR